MSIAQYRLEQVTNDDLLASLGRLADQASLITADLLAHLSEVEHRKLHLAAGASSLFTYCVRVLNWSEGATYKRLQAARAARRFPVLFELVAKGDLHLSAVNVLAPHLTVANHAELLAAARRMSKRAVEELVAARFPRPAAPSSLRRLPTPGAPLTPLALAERSASPSSSTSPAVALNRAADAAGADALVLGVDASSTGAVRSSTEARGEPAARSWEHADGHTGAPPAPQGAEATPAAAPGRRNPVARLEPLSAEYFRLQVTVGRATRDKLLRAQALLRHRQPDGDLAVIVDRALDALLDGLERRKLGKTTRRGAEARARGAVADARTGTAGGASEEQAVGADAAGVEGAAGASARAEPPAPGQAGFARTSAGGEARSRHISNGVRRAVFERDEGRCTFVASDGRRCDERGFLELHHELAFAKGGASTAENVRLLCRAHNDYLATRDYGADFMAQRKARGEATRQAGRGRRDHGPATPGRRRRAREREGAVPGVASPP